MPLVFGSFGSASQTPRARVGALVRKVAKDVDEPVSERFAKSEQHLAKALAIRAEEVGVCDDRHSVRAASSAHVISTWVDGTQEPQCRADFGGGTVFAHDLLPTEERWRASLQHFEGGRTL